MIRTIYRNEFNKPKPFQKASLRESNGKLKRRQLTYDKEASFWFQKKVTLHLNDIQIYKCYQVT